MYLVTGAAGFVGRHFFRILGDRSPASMQYLPVTRQDADITSRAALKQYCAPLSLTGIIHMAAESRTLECENNPDLAWKNNVEATGNLLDIAERKNAWFLYISTDMVFDGKLGNYDIDAPPNPVNQYAKTKVAAEGLVRSYGTNWCIVRPALIYGEEIGGRGSSLSWTLNTLRDGQGNFYTNEHRTPVFVDDLVNLLLFLIKREQTGIVHAGGLERVSRWDFAEKVANIWDLPIGDQNRATLDDTPENQWRPRDLSLKSDFAHQQIPFTNIGDALNLIKSRTSGTL